MISFLKENYKFILIVLLFAIIGGYFSCLYLIDSYDPEMLQEAINQIGSKNNLILLTVVQTVIYALFCSIFGLILAKKCEFIVKFKLDKDAVKLTVIFGTIVGILLILLDKLFFCNYISEVAASYDVKPTINYIISSVTYGAVVEEVMIRLFLMSLFTLILWKIFARKEKEVPVKFIVIANILSSLLFAAGHLPSTAALIGITLVIVVRCFLLNGLAGVLFGQLYRKYGIVYAMVSHGLAHIVSKLIWILFI